MGLPAHALDDATGNSQQFRVRYSDDHALGRRSRLRIDPGDFHLILLQALAADGGKDAGFARMHARAQANGKPVGIKGLLRGLGHAAVNSQDVVSGDVAQYHAFP